MHSKYKFSQRMYNLTGTVQIVIASKTLNSLGFLKITCHKTVNKTTLSTETIKISHVVLQTCTHQFSFVLLCHFGSKCLKSPFIHVYTCILSQTCNATSVYFNVIRRKTKLAAFPQICRFFFLFFIFSLICIC